MTARRLLKAAEAIREVVGMAILTELRDPRIQDVTVVGVEVAPDMKQAKIHVSIMGPPNKQQLTLRGLENARGFLQSKIADRIDTRYTPRLQFVLDQGVKKSLEVGRILEELAAERKAREAELGIESEDDLEEDLVDDADGSSELAASADDDQLDSSPDDDQSSEDDSALRGDNSAG